MGNPCTYPFLQEICWLVRAPSCVTMVQCQLGLGSCNNSPGAGLLPAFVICPLPAGLSHHFACSEKLELVWAPLGQSRSQLWVRELLWQSEGLSCYTPHPVILLKLLRIPVCLCGCYPLFCTILETKAENFKNMY